MDRWARIKLRIGILAVCLAGFVRPVFAAGMKLKVLSTTSIIADWVKNVGGDNVEITTLVGTDGDPHEYQPVPSDSVKLAEASLVFENGVGLERWFDKLYTSAHATEPRCIVSAGIHIRQVPESESEHSNANDDRDPHVYQNVKNAEQMVRNIRDALVKADPSHRADYTARTASYLKQLDELDTFIIDQILSIPSPHRKLVTSHDAFGYFGERYGMDIERSALESVTTEASDPPARQIAAVVDQIKTSGVPAIFVENIQNPKLINQIAAEAGVKVGPPLYSDALGQPGSAGDTYLKMMRYNTEALVNALK